MDTNPVTETSPEVLVDKDAALAAAFQMLCERLGKLEETAEHWLRRKREKEWWRDGILDSQLLGLDRDVELWRDFPRPTCAPPRPLKEYWKFVNISMSDLTTPANLDMNETRRMKTLEAMARLGLQGRQLRKEKLPIKCADVGLDSDFIYLADTVSEEMLRAAVEREPGLTLVGYATHEVQPSLFLENSVPESPESWIRLASRLFDSCGIAAGALRVYALRSDVMRIIVPYHRSRSAAPNKSAPLLAKSKACFDTLNRLKGSQMVEQILRESEFVDFDKIFGLFQSF